MSKILLQDNDHASLLLVEPFEKPLSLEGLVRTIGIKPGRLVIRAQLKFRLSEESGNWRFIKTSDRYTPLDKSLGVQKIIAEGDAISIRNMWELAAAKGQHIAAIRDGLVHDFNCRSPLIEMAAAFGGRLVPGDFKDRDGANYDFSQHGM